MRLPVSARKSHGNGTTTEKTRGMYFSFVYLQFLPSLLKKEAAYSPMILQSSACAAARRIRRSRPAAICAQVETSVDEQIHLMMDQQIF